MIYAPPFLFSLYLQKTSQNCDKQSVRFFVYLKCIRIICDRKSCGVLYYFARSIIISLLRATNLVISSGDSGLWLSIARS